MFLSGYLGLLTAITVNENLNGYYVLTTEVSVPGYARQAITFGDTVNGVCFNSVPYTFGQAAFGQVGLAVFQSPVPIGTGGGASNDFLLLVMPYATPRASGRPRWEQGEEGHLRLAITTMLPYPKGSGFAGVLGFEVGVWNDRYDAAGMDLSTGTPKPHVNAAKLYTPNSLLVRNGTVQPF